MLRMKDMSNIVVTLAVSPWRLLPDCCDWGAPVSVVTLDGKSAIGHTAYEKMGAAELATKLLENEDRVSASVFLL